MIWNKIKDWFCCEVNPTRDSKEYKCALCDVMIIITDGSFGWYGKPSCVSIWNPFFSDRDRIYICSNHTTADIKKLCKEKDCSAISNGWNRWDVD